MPMPNIATLRLGKDSIDSIKKINDEKRGVIEPPFQITVECTQVPSSFNDSYYTLVWLGSDNSKGQATEWKQGFAAIGRVISVERSGEFKDTTQTKVSIGYIFPEPISRIDILREAPTAYYWASAMPIIGLEDRANQTIRIIDSSEERCDISALFYAFNMVTTDFYHEIDKVYQDFKETFNYIPPSPLGDGSTLNGGEVVETENEIKFKTGYRSEFEHNRIVFGAPGTGKSHKLKEDCDSMLAGNFGACERVTFHPDYSYSQFVGTYKPVMDNNSEIRYEFVPGPFMRVYVEALKSSKTPNPQPHVLLVEEINRARVAAVFGDVFQLLDRDDDGVSEYEINTSEDIRKYLVKELGASQDYFKKIRIPDNMFIWATMNSADQGVFPMDTAFKRRWHFEYLGVNQNDSSLTGKITLGKGNHALEVNWNRLRKAINEKLAIDYKINEDKLLGPFFLSKKFVRTNEANDWIANPKEFIEVFKSKLIMYLYEDAAKQHKYKLFDGCDSSKYSSVCDAFDEIGIDIFGDGFRDLYEKQEV
ncbi:McrB family protein [Paenibacillus sp. KR2-11]|uniref:McrB family protein n=1 Tax=Paenibacillus sp. KR2-11 TaxID=3385500 RepID=UPI0038FBFFDD